MSLLTILDCAFLGPSLLAAFAKCTYPYPISLALWHSDSGCQFLGNPLYVTKYYQAARWQSHHVVAYDTFSGSCPCGVSSLILNFCHGCIHPSTLKQQPTAIFKFIQINFFGQMFLVKVIRVWFLWCCFGVLVEGNMRPGCCGQILQFPCLASGDSYPEPLYLSTTMPQRLSQRPSLITAGVSSQTKHTSQLLKW